MLSKLWGARGVSVEIGSRDVLLAIKAAKPCDIQYNKRLFTDTNKDDSDLVDARYAQQDKTGGLLALRGMSCYFIALITAKTL